MTVEERSYPQTLGHSSRRTRGGKPRTKVERIDRALLIQSTIQGPEHRPSATALTAATTKGIDQPGRQGLRRARLQMAVVGITRARRRGTQSFSWDKNRKDVGTRKATNRGGGRMIDREGIYQPPLTMGGDERVVVDCRFLIWGAFLAVLVGIFLE